MRFACSSVAIRRSERGENTRVPAVRPPVSWFAPRWEESKAATGGETHSILSNQHAFYGD
jgi:hypothetical protein